MQVRKGYAVPMVECCCALAEGSAGPVVGTLRVQVVDASRTDVTSPVLASWVRPRIEMSASAELTCSLEVPEPSEDAEYAVQAHLDRAGTGETSVGDYRTMEHFPVSRAMLHGECPVEVRLRLVSS